MAETEHRRNKYERGPGEHQMFCVCGYSTELCRTYDDTLEQFNAHTSNITSGAVTVTRVVTLLDKDGVTQVDMGKYTLIQNGGDHAYVPMDEN